MRLENNEKLKNCSNLEDLINFKVKTIVDALPPDSLKTPETKQYQSHKALEALKRICDPLLTNY